MSRASTTRFPASKAGHSRDYRVRAATPGPFLLFAFPDAAQRHQCVYARLRRAMDLRRGALLIRGPSVLEARGSRLCVASLRVASRPGHEVILRGADAR